MKRICNKFAKPQWRISVPNVAFGRTSPSALEEVPQSPESIKSDPGVVSLKSRPNSFETSDSEQESRYEDASPMYDKHLEVISDEEEYSLYADVDVTVDESPEDTDFEYDVPKISFSFFEPGHEFMCEDPPKVKSEVKITLASPENKALPAIEEKSEDISDSISTDGTTYEVSKPEVLEVTLQKGSTEDICVVLKKCDSVPNIDSDPEMQLYQVPTKPCKRLSQSLSDFNSELTSLTPPPSETPETPSKVTIHHHVTLQPQPNPEDPSSKLDYCDVRSRLPIKIRRPTLLRRPQLDTLANLRTKMGNLPTEYLGQFCKSSTSKCKNFVRRNTSKLFRKREKEDAGDDTSQIVKNDAFFDRVDLKEVDSSFGDPSEVSDKLDVSAEDRSDFDFTTLKTAFRKSRFISEGQNGFDDIRRYVKTGGDFCKELSAILQERSEAEQQYAKSLSKLSGKLARACRDGVGGINDAWKSVAQDMEAKSEIHRQFSASLAEDIVKPLRQSTECQHKTRKQSEGTVDKTARSLAEWRSAEAKSKKHSHLCARDNEKLQDAILDVKLAKSNSLVQLAHMHNHKALSDKESAKLEGKKRKAEDAVKKADIEYYTLCVRAERARLEWESAVLRGSNTFQTLEEERLNNMKSILMCYFNLNNEMCPKISESTEKLRKPISDGDPSKDLSAFINLRSSSQNVSEQLLPDFYCEHITLAMNRERRKQALVKLLHLIKQDLERERKSKNGLENLSRAIKQTPNFGAEDSQQNVIEKLYHMRSMLTYLEGARFKVQNALAELENRQRASHPLSSHITVTRDKSGLQQSVLKVPQWLRDEFIEHEKNVTTPAETPEVPELTATDLPDWTDRGTADGNSNQHDSDFDEFSSQGSSAGAEECPTLPVGKCRALYAYTANLPDELNLNVGDILSVYRKQEDGWWLGECNGCVGIFPATYVENVELKI